MKRPSRCDQCGADVFWAETVPGGKKIMVDIAPTPEGDLILVVASPMVCWRRTRYMPAPVGTPLRRCHWDTCPNRKTATTAVAYGQRKEREPVGAQHG